MNAQKKTVTLRGGVEMPILGLGVYQTSPGEETEASVAHALKVGYRHIDTAAFYANEADVGRAIAKSGVPRSEIFVTTKLINDAHGFDNALRACDESLKKLGLEYMDLYLIHWPVRRLRQESWRALVELQRQGKCRAIGVSNYTIRHLDELFSESAVVPQVNQVEFSPFLYQNELLDHCRKKGIQLEAYSPLTQGEKLNHPKLRAIAQKHQKTSAQIMIRWAVEHDIVVIPKSVRPARIEENAAIFDFSLDKEDMVELDHLNENFRVCWDPTNAP